MGYYVDPYMHYKSVLIGRWNVTLFYWKNFKTTFSSFFQVIYVHITLRSSPLKRRVFVNYDPAKKSKYLWSSSIERAMSKALHTVIFTRNLKMKIRLIKTYKIDFFCLFYNRIFLGKKNPVLFIWYKQDKCDNNY